MAGALPGSAPAVNLAAAKPRRRAWSRRVWIGLGCLILRFDGGDGDQEGRPAQRREARPVPRVAVGAKSEGEGPAGRHYAYARRGPGLDVHLSADELPQAVPVGVGACRRSGGRPIEIDVAGSASGN